MEKLDGMCNKLKTGSNILLTKNRVLEVFKIEIITEKITTKPPINKMVEIELEMAVAIIEPKFEMLISTDESVILEAESLLE